MKRPLTPQQKHRYYKTLLEKVPRLDRAGNRIYMKLTFEEWWGLWQESGKWDQRGTFKGGYVLSRNNDLGSYEIGNCEVKSHADNVRESLTWLATQGRKRTADTIARMCKAQQARVHSAEEIAAVALARQRPCTIDGVKIYPSVKALVADLGQGKHGSRHPNFHYAPKT